MKKVLAIAFLGSLVAVSCSKKADNQLQDSNTMLDEPTKGEMVIDSSYVPETEAESARLDSSKAKVEIKTKAEETAKPADSATKK